MIGFLICLNRASCRLGPFTRSSKWRSGLLLFADKRVNASLRTVVPDFTDLNPRNLILLYR